MLFYTAYLNGIDFRTMLHSQHFLFVTLSEFVGAATVHISIFLNIYRENFP
jgi:hypothetical protein